MYIFFSANNDKAIRNISNKIRVKMDNYEI
jgi:hypothetical protein